MGLLGTKTKQPSERLDYDLDFSEFLPEDDELSEDGSGVVTVVSPTGALAIDAVSVLPGGKTVKIWAAGGVDGATYKITVTATSNGNRIKESEIKIKVKET